MRDRHDLRGRSRPLLLVADAERRCREDRHPSRVRRCGRHRRKREIVRPHLAVAWRRRRAGLLACAAAGRDERAVGGPARRRSAAAVARGRAVGGTGRGAVPAIGGVVQAAAHIPVCCYSKDDECLAFQHNSMDVACCPSARLSDIPLVKADHLFSATIPGSYDLSDPGLDIEIWRRRAKRCGYLSAIGRLPVGNHIDRSGHQIRICAPARRQPQGDGVEAIVEPRQDVMLVVRDLGLAGQWLAAAERSKGEQQQPRPSGGRGGQLLAHC